MESVKKWLSERSAKKNGVYVHYSPPKFGVVSAAQLRAWARGPESKLERAVLAGQGRRLLEEAESLPLTHLLPALVAKCEALHAAVEQGSLMKLQELLEADYNRRKYVMCRDEAGVGLLHKAIYYDFMDIAEYLVKEYPQLVHMKDSEGRTPLHYAALCRDEAGAACLLEGAGGARGARDAAGRTPAAYRGAARTLLALPVPPADMARENKNPPGLVIKRHNIRIWCHDCDMSRLQRVVWEGHGARLLSEVCNQPVVRKFLEAVPYIMNTIRDIHQSVVDNDLEALMKHSGDPVPPQALSSRDTNNMTVMHKAAGLGHGSQLKYLVERYPQGINDIDNDGRTPLHYAAAMRDDQHTYNTLVELGADESIVDNKNKTPAYYVNRPQEIDKSLFKTIPDAPRTPSSAYPSTWDWKLLDNYVIADLSKKTRKKNFKASSENISSKVSSKTVSESTDNNRTSAMKASSTHEFIKELPDLDEGNKVNNDSESKEEEEEKENIHNSKETEEGEENEKTEEHNPQEAENIVDDDTNTAESEKPMEQPAEEEKTEDHQDETKPEAAETAEESNEISHNDNKATENNHEDSNDINDEIPEHDKETTEVPEENNHKNDEKDHAEDNEGSQVDIKENGHVESNSLDEESNIEKTELSHEGNGEQEESHDNKAELYVEAMHKSEEDCREDAEAVANKNIKDEDDDATANEGNYNSSAVNEDDDDVQVPGDTSSEYSEYNLKSTAEASDTGSAKIGHESNGRNTQESLIEGIINGEAEQDSQDASITLRDESGHGDLLVVDNEIDPEVTDLINTANMEMLATLVLNGEGSRLIGRRSGNSELQGFLDNVPSYMKKINQVHVAAREGNLKELQSALDRRKFAIARDPISPNGATPMHVATIFGKTNIMKYLGSRFPETLSAVDFEGRTALHYAAVLPDNGHYYNLMQQLGANSKDLDDNGRSAEEYFKNPSLLPFDQLLSDYGISDEAVQSMFTDKGPTYPDSGHMDIPIFQTDEGRYLAKSLGDPLIKGLTEVANVKPKDPVAFLASFLHNFPEHEKPRMETPQVQESNVILAEEAPEVENEQAPKPLAAVPVLKPPRSAARTATRAHRPIDVVTVDPQPMTSPDAPETAFSSAKRDEHGQSMLHFAAARTHARNALFQLLLESDVSLAYRDELYRTARDVSTQANVPENTTEIDRYVLHLAARGQTDKIMELVMEGYDHILDVVDEEGVSIADVISQRGDTEMSNLLASIPAFEESRDILLGAVRRGDLAAVKEAAEAEGGLTTVVRSQNSFGRTALHIAVLAENEEIVAYLAQSYPELLRIGDNLERTPLHYAMGVKKIESLSRVLIRAGAKRVLKDLKGRQPSYYFMNKSDILRLQEEEEIY